ncbi:hypothetical protein [Nocardioides sp. SYSU D00065]|uniref:hypothetical protein n=1 Tax=Nocardioides sp. SYSU D00065 TaxID=2817378 RepID=UPI001B316B9B|nr:hypothetical protein [Nocardioides sp. SYSU D00065]
MPTQGGAAPAAGASRDTVEVTGTVIVLAGENGQPDRYSLLLPSGRTIELADGFEAEPLSRFTGTVAVPGEGSGRTLTGSLRASTLRRATQSAAPMEVVRARVAHPAPSPGPTNHTTYVAKVTNFGTIGLSDQQILANIDASQQYWVRESAGMIPSWTTVTGVTPVTTTASSVGAGCGLGAGGADFPAVVDSVAAQAYPGVDFSGRSPNHLVIVVPANCSDVTAGRARLGASFASGGPMIFGARPQSQPTIDHEFGHNVGLEHANNIAKEYGDAYEVMGAAPNQYRSPVLGTVYRWEQGIVGAGEVVDASNGGGPWSLAARSAAGGLRSVVFIDPDDGRRHFVDYRNATGNDAGTCYASACNLTDYGYGQSYAPGITIERENESSGAFLHAAGGDGVLTGGETWSNASGTLKVTGNGSTVSVARNTNVPTVAGGSAVTTGPTALRDVTASVSGFSPAPAGYRFQWLFNGQPIANAEERTFRPSLAMAGGALSVAVTAYAPGHNPRTVESARQAVAPASWHAVGARRAPEVSGTTRVGQTLTALGLSWVNYYAERPADLAPTYQWSRNGTIIQGATGPTYRLTAKDLGKTIQVAEYPRAAGYATSTFARSGSTAKVTIGRLATKRPKIAGKARVGKRVVAKTPGWTNGTKFTYQWFVGKSAVKGATKKKLVVTRGMRGKKLVVKVTGKKKGYKKATVKSRPEKVR